MTHQSNALRRSGGFSLVAAAVAVVFAMAHHPTGVAGSLVPLVHGVMIVLAIAVCYGFTCLTLWRGVHHPVMVAAMLVYAFGAVCNIFAAMISGFVAPAVALRLSADSVAALGVSHDINQTLAHWGVYMTGVAYVLFAVALGRGGSGWVKALSALGVFCGIAPLLAIASGAHAMNVAVATIVYSLHMLWALVVGIYLLRVGPAAPDTEMT